MNRLKWLFIRIWNLRYNWKWEVLWVAYSFSNWLVGAVNRPCGWLDTYIAIRIDYDRASAMEFLGDFIGSRLTRISYRLYGAWHDAFYGTYETDADVKPYPNYVPPKFKRIVWVGYKSTN